MKKNLMVLIVAYNAQNTITNLLDRIPKEIWRDASEIVVADDSSPDKTAEVANSYKIKKKKKNLTITRHEKNKGYGGNQKWGYNYALKKGYDYVVMLHGDVQYAPEDILRILKPMIENHAGFAFGSRMAGNPLRGGMPLYKFFGNKFLTTVQNLILIKDLSEYHSGYRIYSMESLKKIPFNLNSDDFHFDTEIIIQMIMAKEKIIEVPIQTHYGNEKCYVRVIPYGLNVLKAMGQYILHQAGIRRYRKYVVLTKI